MNKYKEDILIVTGLCSLGSGIYLTYGLGNACIIVGTVLLLFGTIMAFKKPKVNN